MPITYSTMASDVKRFQPTGREPVMQDVVYDIDTAHKQGLSTAIRPGGKSQSTHPRSRHSLILPEDI